MDVIIRNSSNQPIYEQIFTQLKNQIVSGELSEGEALPSIRALAKDLRISVITTKRAYDELEAAGFIDTVAGKGCFVAALDTELLREQHLQELEAHLRKVRELATLCGLDENELIELYRLVKEDAE